MTFHVTLFTKENCSLCDQAEADLKNLQSDIPHELFVVKIDEDPDLVERYAEKVPVINAGPFIIEAPFDIKKLKMSLGAARDSNKQKLEDQPKKHRKRIRRRKTVTRADKITYFITRRYMGLLNLFLFLFVGLPFLAPVLMNAGLTGLARPIYAVYSATCHQLAFRSWFLFGDQAAYPRAAAQVDTLTPYGEATGLSEANLLEARAFRGNEEIGFKVAFCERDVAIYFAMLIFGLLFAASKGRIPPLPWYLWILIGIAPIGLDGFSQLFSQIPALGWIPYRESTPLLRTLTGALFGFTTAWFGFPLVGETMEETRVILATKFARYTGNAG